MIKKNVNVTAAYDKGVRDGAEMTENQQAESMVQHGRTCSNLEYTVSYGKCAPWCGNTMPRTSVYVEPHYNNMPGMCMCTLDNRLSMVDPLYVELTFTVNSSNLNFKDLFRGSRQYTFSAKAADAALHRFMHTLETHCFLDEFAKSEGAPEDAPGYKFHDMHFLPSLASDDQIIVRMTVERPLVNIPLITALTMEFMKLIMLTITSMQIFQQKYGRFSSNLPDGISVFDSILVTDTETILKNLWEHIKVIKAANVTTE